MSVESLRGFTIGKPLGCRGSACVEVMTTLYGSTPSLRRRAEGCVPPEGSQFKSRLSLESHSWRRVPRTIDQSRFISERLDQLESSRQDPHPAGVVTDETIPHASQTAQTRPPGCRSMVPTIGILDWPSRRPRLRARVHDETDQIAGRSTVMRAHGIDDAQLVALFPMSLSGQLRGGLLQRELEATRQRPEESISSFVTRWRAKVAGMIDRPKEQDQIDMVLRNLQPRFARRLVGIPFQDLRSLVHAAFSVEEAMARGLWTDTTPSPDSKGKKLIGPLTRSGEYQYQLDYAQEPYIAQTSMQPRPPHPRAATHPRLDHMHRGPRQFTPLGMTLTRAFEKLRDAGVIVPLAPRPLPHPIPPHFRSHEHCLYHQIPGHDTEHCSALHHAIQDLIDSGVVDLARPSVTTNPLPAHSTHAVPPPPGLQ
ncbi:hypothetical protein CK203_048163 [Vitis vinifera]|uniref:Retrotransposon gag domain-containing protein n=1 Tax=Vitis vinifera TaxID=29760 RepID=A0A438H377_VITVI|nr:hypothetical protein CK203_048163 [Vitis vinifera]